MDQSKFFELVDREKVEKLINKDFLRIVKVNYYLTFSM